MKYRLSRKMVVLIFSMVIVGLALPARAAVTPQQVQQAIEDAKNFLYSQQKDGNWENFPTADPTNAGGGGDVNGWQWGGRSAMATLALVVAGDAADPRVQQAAKFVVSAEIRGIYVLGMRDQLLALLPQSKEVHEAEKKDFKLLLHALGETGKEKGLYSYGLGEPTYHTSPSQFGVLGMWQLSEVGVEVPNGYWQTIDEAWRRIQTAEGSWNYHPDDLEHQESSRPSMTAAGVATLFITKTMLGINQPTDCKAPPEPDTALEKGLKYLGDHFRDIPATPFPFYTWYGMERIGLASGRRDIGGNDWYQIGCEFMVAQPDNDVVNSAFKLLFLCRGSAPVVMQKLQYPAADPPKGKPGSGNLIWNQRPRDSANLVNWMGQQLETTLAWQSIDISEPEEAFDDAPILYISGSTDPKLTEAQKAKLRQYVEDGGLIVANDDCNTAMFKQWFIKLGKELFPSYEFRELPPRHPIFLNEQFKFPADKPHPELSGISNGVRELMVLLSGDTAAAWQSQAKITRKSAFQIGSDLYIYTASGRPSDHARHRGEDYYVRPLATAPAAAAKLTMARLTYTGNWDPEPAGWKRLAAILHNAGQLELTVNNVELGKDDLSAYKFAHLTGTGPVKFTPEQLAAIKAYVSGGGTLLIDAAGGSGEFIDTVTKQLQALFPTEMAGQDSVPLLPEADPVYTTGGAIKVHYRPATMRSEKYQSWHEPHLRSIIVNNRPAIYFSEEDLSAGLVGATSDGIIGYEPATAVELTSRILMNVINPPATAKPATVPTTAPATNPTK